MENETKTGPIVNVAMCHEQKAELMMDIAQAMELKGLKSLSDLDLGIELPEHWPVCGDIDLSQLVVIANKLKQPVYIGNIRLGNAGPGIADRMQKMFARLYELAAENKRLKKQLAAFKQASEN